MKTNLALSALVVATTLIVCGGCTDPETIAKRSADQTPEVERATVPRNIAGASNGGSPAGGRDAETSETATRSESNQFTGSDSPLVGDRDGRESSVPKVTHTAAGNLADSSSSSGTDADSSDLDSNSESTEPVEKEPLKEEYKFEIVSHSGEEGFEPGDTIPEISGSDLDNIKFNLTDYQGKVVMLDFWGDW
jgi:hypothetical protein